MRTFSKERVGIGSENQGGGWKRNLRRRSKEGGQGMICSSKTKLHGDGKGERPPRGGDRADRRKENISHGSIT